MIYKCKYSIAISVISLIGILALCCCKRRGSTPDIGFVPVDTIFYDENVDTLPIGQICDIQWLPLKETDNGLFKEMSKLMVLDSIFVVVDQPYCKITVFTSQGDFLYQIDNRGQGPEEYLEIAAATATDSLIYVVDNYGKRIQRYLLSDGSYAGSINLPFIAWDIEAFSDNDFLFTCLNSSPEAKIVPKPIDYAVWHTDSLMEVKHTYLPLPENHVEMIGKRKYFVKDNKGNITFHCYKYPGYFTFAKDQEPQYHNISFYNGIPNDEILDYHNIQEKNYIYLDETPYVHDNCWVALIAQGQYARQMIGLNAMNKVVRNSSSSAANAVVNVIGVNNDGFIGYINDGYQQYKGMTDYGFHKADSVTESHIEKGGCALIMYRLCQDL